MMKQNYEWRRRLKRKVNEGDEAIEQVTREWGGDLVGKQTEAIEQLTREGNLVGKQNETIEQVTREAEELRALVGKQNEAIEQLTSEVEEERNAAASAADETMTMISRLQKEKAELQMETSQFKRLTEGKLAHNQQELAHLENLLYRKEEMIKALECEIQAFKHKMLSIGFENENMRSPDEEIRCYLPDSYNDGFDLYDYDTQAKETSSLKVRVDDRDDAFSSFHVLQSDDAQNRCGDILQVWEVEKGTQWHQPDREWTQVRESPSRKLGANVVSSKNGSKCHLRPSPDSVDSSYRLIEAAEETPGGNEGLSNFYANSLYSSKRSIFSQPVDDTSDRKPTVNNVLEYPNSSATCSGHKPFKRNAERLSEFHTLPQNYEACVATKTVLVNENKVLSNEQVTYMPSPRKGSGSAHITSEDIMNEISKGNDALPSMKVMPEASNSRNVTFPMEGMNDRDGNRNDVPEVQNETIRSGQCKSVNGNQDWYRDVKLSSPKRHNGHWAEYASELSERKGETMTDFPVKSSTESGLGPTPNEIKQLVHRIQALEEERQCMKHAIQYFERENLSCIALLKEIARQHYEVQLPPNRSKYDTKRIPSPEGLSILHVVKWIFSYVFRRNVKRCQSKYMHDVSSHSVGLLLLLENTYKQRLGAYIRGVRINDDSTQYCIKNCPGEMRLKCV